MKQIKLTSESLQRVIALCDLPDVVICVCEKDFFINQAILSFISTKLDQHFSNSQNPFIISIDDDDISNPLFEGVSCESLIESCSFFISLIKNGTSTFPSQLHIPSLILFSQKIFCNDFLELIISFSTTINSQNSCSLSSKSLFKYEPSNLILNSF
jgi:hypothetical protein